MNTRKMMLAASMLCLSVLLAGCGPNTDAQLKKTQADLAACDKQAGELGGEVAKAQASIKKLSEERDEAINANKFLAKKANSNEQIIMENAKVIADLKAEIAKNQKTIEEMKAAAEKAAAVPAAPVAPATNGTPQ
jgi:septal ring factor EnvC (AmiA/AmiB activator)